MLRTVLGVAFLTAALATPAHAALVGHWTFDADSIADTSGSGYHGTLASGSYSSDVPAAIGSGRSLDLTGGNHYAIIDAPGAEAGLDLHRGATVSTWMKGFPDGGWEPAVSKRGESGQGWQLRRYGGSSQACWTTRGTGTEDQRGTSNINNANWKHLAGTYNGWFKSLYVGGTPESRATVSGNINNTNSLVVFGARDNSGTGSPPSVGNYSRVMLDDVAIHNVGLTANQVAHIAGGGDPASLPAPVMSAAEELPKNLAYYTVQQPDGTWNVFTRTLTTATWDEQRVRAGTVAYNGVAGHLASIHSAAEEAVGQRLCGGGSLFVGLTDSTGTSTLDSTNFAALGTAEGGNTSGQPLPASGTPPVPGERGYGFQWITGEPFTYQNWSSGEPNDASHEDIVQLRSGGWNDHNGGPTMVGAGDQGDNIPYDHALVEFPTASADKPVIQGEAKIDPVTGLCYERVMTPLTWDEARLAAEQRQFGGVTGHLAAISDFNENEAVRAGGDYTNNWIGMTDSDQTSALDGTPMGGTEFGNTGGNPYPPGGNRGDGWVWVTGEPMAYRNWRGSEPNESGGEDAGQMAGDGGWNDNKAGWSLGQSNTLMTSVVEYEVARFNTLSYLERKADTSVFVGGNINNVGEARMLMDLPSGDSQILAEAQAGLFAISFTDPQRGGGYAGVLRHPFLTDTGADDDDFAALVLGQIVIPTAGDWTFALFHDDGFELTVGPNTYQAFTGTGAPRLINGANVFNFPTPGAYNLELLWYERGGGAYLQLFAAPGNLQGWDPNQFRLVGDVWHEGLAIFPEPTTLSLLVLGGGAAALRRRRRAKARSA